MAISSLVTGSVFQRPAISFSNKQTDYKLEKVSYLLNNKSTIGDLAVSMSNLNSQLKQMQKISKDVIKSIVSVLNTITKTENDMTIRFRRLIKEISDSRTEFTKGLAGIVPSIRGGEGLAVNPIALGPVAAATATASQDSIPPSGNSTWDAFISFLQITAPLLLSKIGKKIATMAALAATGVGWIGVAIGFALSISDAIELYKLWKQFKNEKPDQAEIDGAMASYNKSQPPVGAPQGAARTDMSMAGETGAFAAAAGAKGAPQQTQTAASAAPTGAGAGRGNVIEEPGARAAAQMGAGAGRGTVVERPGERAAAGMPVAPLPPRRPTESAAPVKTSAPAPQATAPVDPHVKSRAMFQQAQDMEREGNSGATAMFFAADKQRMSELASAKQTAAAPGAPAKKKVDTTGFGRGGGHMTGEAYFGRGGGHMTGESRFGRGGGDHTFTPNAAGLAGGEEAVDAGAANAQMNREKIQGPMESMVEKKERAEAAGRYDIDDDSMSRATDDRAKLESDLAKREAIASGEKTPAQVRGTLRQAGEQIKPNAADLAQGTPAGTPTPPATTNKIKPEFEPGKAGQTGQILMQNINDYNATQTSSGGEANNIAGTNMPLTANNPSLQEYLDRQHLIFQ